MNKKCGTCSKSKPLSEFFQPPVGAASSWQGTSTHCKQCHSEAKVPHGYGWYGDKYTSPDWSAA